MAKHNSNRHHDLVRQTKHNNGGAVHIFAIQVLAHLSLSSYAALSPVTVFRVFVRNPIYLDGNAAIESSGFARANSKESPIILLF